MEEGTDKVVYLTRLAAPLAAEVADLDILPKSQETLSEDIITAADYLMILGYGLKRINAHGAAVLVRFAEHFTDLGEATKALEHRQHKLKRRLRNAKRKAKRPKHR